MLRVNKIWNMDRFSPLWSCNFEKGLASLVVFNSAKKQVVSAAKLEGRKCFRSRGLARDGGT